MKYAVSKPPVSDIGKDYSTLGALNFLHNQGWHKMYLPSVIPNNSFFFNAIWNAQRFIILFPAYNGEFSILGKGIIFSWRTFLWVTLKVPVAFSEADSATNAKSRAQISIQSPVKSVEAIPMSYVGLGSGPLWFPCSLKPSLSTESTE